MHVCARVSIRPSFVTSQLITHTFSQQDNQPQPQPQQPTHPTPPQTTPDDTLTPTATSTPIKPSDPYTYKPSRSEIYGAPETPKQPTEDVYAIPNKLKKSRSTTPKPEPEREPKTVAGYTGLTGTIVNVLVPKNKPRLGMSVNGGSNTKQKEIRLRDVQVVWASHFMFIMFVCLFAMCVCVCSPMDVLMLSCRPSSSVNRYWPLIIVH